MLARVIAVVATGTLLAACANDNPLRDSLGGPAAASDVDHEPSMQTLAWKVLGAIALENVTGRKPDPARFNELQH
jgi:hypothetical protein